MKRFNFDELLWFIVLILLNISLSYLVIKGKVNFYVDNDMIKYLYITILIISIITIFQIKNIFTPKGSIKIKIKLAPIILALILGGISFNKQQTFKHAELNMEIKENKTSIIDKKSLLEHEFDYNLNKNEDTKENLENNNQKVLIVNEKNPMILDDIRINPEKYIGKELEIHGFVCKENYLNKNQFIIGRLVMNYAADSKVVGIIGEYDRAYSLSENEKINVTGKIGSSTVKDDDNISRNVPIIVVEKLESEN